ncbi:protein AAR2 homolog [Trichonephila inaurata madagascariensis]|uniref:Protein AAR2 homolog n=1 Tax=Trichonephila inaurata madagascariensis TaxID=2747483 RepID=A0A8X6XFS5_9ARAC|nr:protein AAR2 homolog [Trichonephila inaurata madagascariensis]
MASSSNKRHSSESLKMSPEKALKLFDNGGVLIVLNLPIGSVFGIDMKVYQVGDKFLGLKMIPPGLHFIYYSAVSKEGCVAPRTGFFYFFSPQEIVIKKWDSKNEDLNSLTPSGEEKQRIRENLQNLDRNLGAYPYQTLKQWNCLTCNISESLVNQLQPLCGTINSVTQLVPLNYPTKESSEPDSTTDKRFQSLEEKYLPNMKQVPGTEIRFTEIPKNRYPDGCSAAQITMYNMDSTYLLEQLLKHYQNKEDILGELQMAHVCFLIAHVYDAFEHWKNLVQVLCSVDSGLEKYSDILTTFLTLLHYQLKEIPSDFFVDITSEHNFLVNTLQIFFENVKSSEVNEQFKSYVDKFRKNLTTIYKWDFEAIPEDEQPVVVEF